MRRSNRGLLGSSRNTLGSSGGSTSALAGYQKSYEEAKAANEQRYSQGLGLLDEAISRYQPGGGFGAGAMSLYEQGKSKAMASGMQNLVSSGLSNTTIAAGMPLAYEQEVGTPFRLQLEDLRMQNLTEAERAKASFIEGRTDAYPDANMFANLAAQGASGGSGGTSYDYSGLTGRYMGSASSNPSSGSSYDSGGSGSNWVHGSKWSPSMNNPYSEPASSGAFGNVYGEAYQGYDSSMPSREMIGASIGGEGEQSSGMSAKDAYIEATKIAKSARKNPAAMEKLKELLGIIGSGESYMNLAAIKYKAGL